MIFLFVLFLLIIIMLDGLGVIWLMSCFNCCITWYLLINCLICGLLGVFVIEKLVCDWWNVIKNNCWFWMLCNWLMINLFLLFYEIICCICLWVKLFLNVNGLKWIGFLIILFCIILSVFKVVWLINWIWFLLLIINMFWFILLIMVVNILLMLFFGFWFFRSFEIKMVDIWWI